jgi:hypothetical protein
VEGLPRAAKRRADSRGMLPVAASFHPGSTLNLSGLSTLVSRRDGRAASRSLGTMTGRGSTRSLRV